MNRWFIDHFDELYGLVEITKLLQKTKFNSVNMDVGVYPQWDRFGFNYRSYQAWQAIVKIMNCEKMELVGLHCHIGTFMRTTNAYAGAAAKLCDLAYNIQLKWNTLESISWSRWRLHQPILSEVHTCRLTAARDLMIMLKPLPPFWILVLNRRIASVNSETGRALIDDAGYLLGTVLANKRLSDGRRATIMDFGVNILFTAWFGMNIKFLLLRIYSSFGRNGCIRTIVHEHR